jgi:hypothetical protein
VPTVQTVHILAISAVIGSALMIALRALGVSARDQSLGDVTSRFLPVIGWSLPALLGTGLLMITAEPARSLENTAFLLKLLLLLAAIAVTAVFRAAGKETGALGQGWLQSRWKRSVLSILFFSLWVAIIFAGRWIAYVEPS